MSEIELYLTTMIDYVGHEDFNEINHQMICECLFGGINFMRNGVYESN